MLLTRWKLRHLFESSQVYYFQFILLFEINHHFALVLLTLPEFQYFIIISSILLLPQLHPPLLLELPRPNSRGILSQICY